MGSKNFPGSWGCNFVVSVIRIILTNITNGYVQVHGDVNSWPRATHKSHEHWSPTNKDDFTVYHIHSSQHRTMLSMISSYCTSMNTN